MKLLPSVLFTAPQSTLFSPVFSSEAEALRFLCSDLSLAQHESAAVERTIRERVKTLDELKEIYIL